MEQCRVCWTRPQSHQRISRWNHLALGQTLGSVRVQEPEECGTLTESPRLRHRDTPTTGRSRPTFTPSSSCVYSETQKRGQSFPMHASGTSRHAAECLWLRCFLFSFLQTICLHSHRSPLLQTGKKPDRQCLLLCYVAVCDSLRMPVSSIISTHLPGLKVKLWPSQIKRRPSEALPELLLPVSPITSYESSQLQDSPSGLASLESGLSHLEVDDWDFWQWRTRWRDTCRILMGNSCSIKDEICFCKVPPVNNPYLQRIVTVFRQVTSQQSFCLFFMFLTHLGSPHMHKLSHCTDGLSPSISHSRVVLVCDNSPTEASWILMYPWEATSPFPEGTLYLSSECGRSLWPSCSVRPPGGCTLVLTADPGVHCVLRVNYMDGMYTYFSACVPV